MQSVSLVDNEKEMLGMVGRFGWGVNSAQTGTLKVLFLSMLYTRTNLSLSTKPDSSLPPGLLLEFSVSTTSPPLLVAIFFTFFPFTWIRQNLRVHG